MDLYPLYDIYGNNLYLIKEDDEILAYRTETDKSNTSSKVYLTFNLIPLYPKIYEKVKKYMNRADIELIKKLDLNKLHKKFKEKFDEKGITCYLRACISKLLFYNYPLYFKNEMIGIVSNYLGRLIEDIDELGKYIYKIEMDTEVLESHTKYLINSTYCSFVQLYTFTISKIVNDYLRNNEKDDPFIETLITGIWKTILEAPTNNNEYILYKFIANDAYLEDYKEGNIYIEKGFMSTTRHPIFTKGKIKAFGYILIKIIVPKNSHYLCIEGLSQFPNETEVLLPPLSSFRIEKIIDNGEYYYPRKNTKNAIKMKRIYVLKYLSNGDIIKYKHSKDDVKLLEDKKIDNIDDFINNFCINHKFKIKVDENEYVIRIDKHHKTKEYSNLITETGYYLFGIYKDTVIFDFKFYEEFDIYVKTNRWYGKMNELKKYYMTGSYELTDKEYIKIMDIFKNAFGLNDIIIYCRYDKCKQIGGSYIQQNEYMNFMINKDIYDFFKHNIVRFVNDNEQNKVMIFKLQLLKLIKPFKLLRKELSRELYNLYNEFKKKNKHGDIGTFYIWLCDNYCYISTYFLDLVENEFYIKNKTVLALLSHYYFIHYDK